MLQIVKLGGSIITNKQDAVPTVQIDVLSYIMQSLQTYTQGHNDGLILIHGAGAHGHGIAAEYDLVHGVRGDDGKKQAALQCQSQVTILHTDVINQAREANLQIISIPTHTVVIQTEGKISSFELTEVRAALKAGKIPVLYGDVVPDTAWEYSICSGDAIAAYLAKECEADRLLFASDIDGIFTADPHTEPTAALIHQVSVSDIVEGKLGGIGGSHNTDVTGGLLGKLQSFVDIIDETSLKEVVIFNGIQKDRLVPALTGELDICTRVETSRTAQ